MRLLGWDGAFFLLLRFLLLWFLNWKNKFNDIKF